MKGSRDRDDHGKVRAVRRVEIEKEIVRVFEVAEAAGPGIVIDAPKPRQEQKRRAVIRGRVVNLLSFFFGLERRGLEPIWQAFAQVLLKKGLPVDSIRIASQNQSAVLEKGQHVIRHSIVVGEKLALGVTGFGK